VVRCGVPCVGLCFLLYVFTVFCCMCLWCGVVGVLGGGCVMVVATMWCVCVMVCTALPPHMPICSECCVCARWRTSHRAMPMPWELPSPASGCLLCCDGLRSGEICAVHVLLSAPRVVLSDGRSLLYVCGLEGTDAMV
jgi:hypothetical protein